MLIHSVHHQLLLAARQVAQRWRHFIYIVGDIRHFGFFSHFCGCALHSRADNMRPHMPHWYCFGRGPFLSIDIWNPLCHNSFVSTTPKDILHLAIGGIASWLILSLASFYLSPSVTPCGFDGQPDAHWQEEFNKLDHEWKMVGYCLESKPLAECKKEWGK